MYFASRLIESSFYHSLEFSFSQGVVKFQLENRIRVLLPVNKFQRGFFGVCALLVSICGEFDGVLCKYMDLLNVFL